MGGTAGGVMILKRAEELGRLVGQSEEYQALKRANERLMADGALKAKLEELRTLQVGVEEKLERGQEPPADVRTQMDALLGVVQASPIYQGFVAAQANFDKLMTRLNEQMFEGIRLGGESRIITLT
jgi:cell fate (sporulation/competence/biofilm development) regulator YlbF (YheA/YmcA/DUF963 family)